MKPSGTQCLWVLVTLAMVVCFSAAASAAEASPEDGWQFGVEVYLWGASIGGKTSSGSNLDIEFDDLIDNLEMAFMGAFGARRGKWSLLADVIYLDVKGDETISGIPASVEMSSWIVTPAVGYTLLDAERGSLDLYVGARYLYLDTDLSLGPFRKDKSGDGWDGIVGIRGKLNLSEKWYLPYGLDIGTGNADMTWQGNLGIGYRFKHLDIVAGYRYMAWDLGGDVIDDLDISGPYGGIKFIF